ncbi:MAG: HAMP domain-containing histidine kinase [Ruminococcaceae bacterium]|nr:HAMP domain-containing histidine kinase [Oscillospiraceae bacterium]
MKLKIFKKLFLTTSAVLVTTLTLLFVLMSITISDKFAKEKHSILNNSCDVISSALASNGESVFAESVIRSISEVNSIDIFVSDGHGRIILCGCSDFEKNHSCYHTNSILSREFLSQITGETKIELTSIDKMYDSMNYTAVKKVTDSFSNEMYILAVSDVMNAKDTLKLMFGMYAISAIIPVLFMFIAEYSIVYRIIRPLKYMSLAAKSVAQGDFSKRVPVMSNDEIGELSVLFNKMTDSLSRSESTSKNFVANVSHELKTPMTTISGFIDGIIDGTIDDSKKDYYLRIISQEVKRLSRLVQSMISLSKLESGENPINYDTFRLSDTVIAVAMSMEQSINDKNIDICGLDRLTETEITGDCDLIYQVIYNLTDNAVKFTQEYGKIDFSLHRIEDKLEFKIKNTGDGIPQKDLPHIFERFYKTDKSRSSNKESLGLGLYICKTIVEIHEGKINVISKQGEFTEFTVVLPINYEKRR